MRWVVIKASENRLNVRIQADGRKVSVSRDEIGIELLILLFHSLKPVIIAIEPIGSFETVVAAGFISVNLPVVMLKSGGAKTFAHAPLRKRAKPNPNGAMVIAEMIDLSPSRLPNLPDETKSLLLELVSRRRQIIHLVMAEGHRQRRMADRAIQSSIAKLRKVLECELTVVDADIESRVKQLPIWLDG